MHTTVTTDHTHTHSLTHSHIQTNVSFMILFFVILHSSICLLPCWRTSRCTLNNFFCNFVR